jgi:uncharacterized protein (TIGR02722 family)
MKFRPAGKNRLVLITLLGIVILMYGCSATTREISPDANIHYDEAYDFTDKKAIVNDLVKSLLGKPPLVARYDRPVIIVYGVRNRTSEHIDTSGITDDIRREILQSGKARFVNKVQRGNIIREMAYQYGGNVDPATRVEKARQIGAEYMLTGTLRSIEKHEPKQWRTHKKTLMYYSLTLELTDLKTGLVEWTDSAEIARESSKPIIGW